MMKTSTKIAIAAALMGCLATQAYAAEGGNPKKGKHLYKKECKACHSQAGEGGELTPMSKTMSQWDRFFDKDKHKLKPEAFNDLTEQDLKDIQQFLYDHAADSEQPQTCG
ncbi:c-type cytochrome [Shewanella sp. ZOR0012]|uniref:cytochrome c n=1 Tax=Shewanella sp. ZOR0012 TaxID=1339231 RepID=UPI0006491B39|nr:c-type cytochrome [Shewanella sp. ZOR0012]NSM23057.1 c-type cytochrome [Shewanella sp. ZOR0012]